MKTLAIGLLICMCLSTGTARAHALQPGYLALFAEAHESATDKDAVDFEVLWKRPSVNGERLAVTPAFPSNCEEVRAPSTQMSDNFWVSTARIRCAGGLRDQTIHFKGLAATKTDLVVRVQYPNGQSEERVVKPSHPEITLSGDSRLGDYLALGVAHILGGFDHLMFVLGLMLLVLPRLGMLLKTITAFTLAHSLTLALVSLGFWFPPPALTEALIALSIFFLAPEIVRRWRGQSSFSLRHPWVMALFFGLLHGCGFAGALGELGLPRSALPLALLGFNVGVEIGQLLFIAVCVAIWQLQRQFAMPWMVQRLPGYAVGSLAAWWAIERVVPLL